MNAIAKTIEAAPGPLARLREPFPAHQVSKLPKPTKQQTDEVRADYKKGVRCQVCGSWHHPAVVHLDYVGHAALTDRLLDVDETWSWEPLAFRDGLPAFDATGGLWIKLTVCGVTRLGYGHAAAKPNMDPGAREKEVIGDALRNAAMRFGAALDLWHKGDLHVPDDSDDVDASEGPPSRGRSKEDLAVVAAESAIIMCADLDELKAWGKTNAAMINALPKPQADKIAKAYKIRVEALKDAPRPPEPPLDPNDPFSDEIPL